MPPSPRVGGRGRCRGRPISSASTAGFRNLNVLGRGGAARAGSGVGARRVGSFWASGDDMNLSISRCDTGGRPTIPTLTHAISIPAAPRCTRARDGTP